MFSLKNRIVLDTVEVLYFGNDFTLLYSHVSQGAELGNFAFYMYMYFIIIQHFMYVAIKLWLKHGLIEKEPYI